jgi:pimeloyl-ACP methyl ester carboxylesterase
MSPSTNTRPVQRHTVDVAGAQVELLVGGRNNQRPLVAFAHPTDVFGVTSIDLFASVARAPIACVNAHSTDASSLDAMVERIEAARRQLGLDRWIFWGMSGGGWLAQIYAHRHPEALAGIVIESACLCFRERLADPACVLSPFFPAWREGLVSVGLLSEDSHREVDLEGDSAWVNVEGVGRVFRRREGPALLVSPAPLAPEMEAAMPTLWRFDARPWITSLDLPTLVLCGSADPVVPTRRARAIHDALPDSTFVVIEGAGHVPSAERHPQVLRAFDAFVESLTRA